MLRRRTVVSIALLSWGCSTSGTSTLTDGGSAGSGAFGGSSGASGSAGSAGASGSGGNTAGAGAGGSGGIDCSNVGCAQAPLCSEGCQAACGCCGCAPGDTRTVGGETLVCSNDCFAPRDPCACPESAPVDGASCGPTCSGAACAYEDCAGIGLTLARCTSGTWAVAVGPCGGQPCGPQGSSGGQTCGPGFACIHQTGGADFPEECRPHDCATGPISCACVGAACPGECRQTGAIDFTCDTCPGGGCP